MDENKLRKYEKRLKLKEEKRCKELEEEKSKKEKQYARDTFFMKEAIKQGMKAYELEETPIGCVIVMDDKVIARAYNRRNTDKNTLAHAEILAIKKASKKQKDWRLDECTMYVTLEPCPMCAGAIVQSRMKRVVIGAMNPKAGCAGSIIDLLHMPEFNHQVVTEVGVCEESCSNMMSRFFQELRQRKNG